MSETKEVTWPCQRDPTPASKPAWNDKTLASRSIQLIMQQPLASLAEEITALLKRVDWKIVFAESCTGGLISATLSRVPGVSQVHCGSAVVYRLDTKTKWLGVPTTMLEEFGAVSESVARAMSQGVLANTPESDVAVSITGHLGPDAPPEQDGLIFVGIASRGNSCRIVKHRLGRSPDPILAQFPGDSQREQRQWAAVEIALTHLATILRETISGRTPSA